MSEDLDSWMKSGQYLPDFMRDFHDQKDLFKAVDEVAQRSIANGNRDIENVSWRAGHVYTVDIFLWVMAKHGYTLQRTRRRFPFREIRDFVADAMIRWKQQATAVLRLDEKG